jgi:hypothetical protein
MSEQEEVERMGDLGICLRLSGWLIRAGELGSETKHWYCLYSASGSTGP